MSFEKWLYMSNYVISRLYQSNPDYIMSKRDDIYYYKYLLKDWEIILDKLDKRQTCYTLIIRTGTHRNCQLLDC